MVFPLYMLKSKTNKRNMYTRQNSHNCITHDAKEWEKKRLCSQDP